MAFGNQSNDTSNVRPQRRTFGVVSDIAAGITGLRNFVFNTLFIIVMVFIVMALLVNCQGTSVPNASALVLNLRGNIVESPTLPDPLQGLLTSNAQSAEVPLYAVLRSIEEASNDEAIKMLVLDLDELTGAAPAHTQQIGGALQAFKDTGKKIVAYGLYYGQSQYHLASFADAVYMHPMGQVSLEGYGGYQFYFKELLDKLDINVHVFRVGEFKAAVEPMVRDDMSPEARLANEALYQNLWQQLVDDVASNRSLTHQAVQDYSDNLHTKLNLTQGDLARVALENHLVDELLTADQARVRMANDVGYAAQGGDINGIDYLPYLAARGVAALSRNADNDDQVAVIVAQGEIVGEGQGNSVIAADPTIALIRQARFDSRVKALVLRVDSPGGSAFASELIRQELELVQLAGKPVVASFGGAAASGGYWISATSDAIVAHPTTITGSIGIFGLIPTFENALDRVGVHSDGVGTTSLTLGFDPFAGINERMAIIQQSLVNNGYEQFITLVARGRDKTPEQVREVAEGRVWAGDVALELGLVDALGGIDVALAKAAELAELDEYGVMPLSLPQDPRRALLAQLLPNVEGALASQADRNDLTRLMQLASQSDLFAPIAQAMERLARMDDPQSVYAICEACWLQR